MFFMKEYTQEQMDAMREALKAYKNYLNVRDMVLVGFTSPLDPAVTNYFNTVPQEVRRDLGDRLDKTVEFLVGIAARTQLFALKSSHRRLCQNIQLTHRLLCVLLLPLNYQVCHVCCSLHLPQL